MTKAERARQIEAEEFRRESEQALARALAYSKQKREEYRRLVLGLEELTEPLRKRSRKRDKQHSQLAALSYRKAKEYTVDGRTMTAPQWADRLGISYQSLWSRAKKLGSMEAAVNQPVVQARGGKTIEFNGLSLTRKQWAVYFGISYCNFCRYISQRGMVPALEHLWAKRHPGVASDLSASIGTGAGAVLQEMPNITFSEDA
jgi:hypothetical protein